jgi:Arc/MetJ family transcription regulator
VCGGPRWKQVKCGPGRIRSSGLKSSAPASARALPGCSCSPVPVDLEVRVDGRLPEPVEVSAYYIVAQALTNAAKHARASTVGVEAEVVGDLLRVTVRDDGAGGADLASGTGLAGLKDRVGGARRPDRPSQPRRAGYQPARGTPLSATNDGVASR